MTTSQKFLSPEQIKEFHHDEFVADQVRHFGAMLDLGSIVGPVVDVGGGVGHFAKSLAIEYGCNVRAVDLDQASIASCKDKGVPAILGDALNPPVSGDEGCACFNLILHHLIGSNENETQELQMKALKKWRGKVPYIFVNEYIYESFFWNISGKLIYFITASKILSSIGRLVSRVIPSFNANTFGVGVRFRAHEEWRQLFNQAGFEVVTAQRGDDEVIALPLRLLQISSIRRDSFLLITRAGKV